jgi:hypothetical protein
MESPGGFPHLYLHSDWKWACGTIRGTIRGL